MKAKCLQSSTINLNPLVTAQAEAYKDWLYDKVTRNQFPSSPNTPNQPATSPHSLPPLPCNPAFPLSAIFENASQTGGDSWFNYFSLAGDQGDGNDNIGESRGASSHSSGGDNRGNTGGNLREADIKPSTKPLPDKPPTSSPSDLSSLFDNLHLNDDTLLHVVLVASPRMLDRGYDKVYYNSSYHLHTAEAEVHGIKMKAERTPFHRVCVLDSGDHHISPNSFFCALKQRDFHSLTVIAHGISDPGVEGEDGMIAFVDSQNGAFYPCRVKHFADELFNSDTKGTLELLFLNGCCTNILGHAIVNKWVAEGKYPPVIIAWKERVMDMHAFRASQIFFEEYFKSRAGNVKGACRKVESYCRACGTRKRSDNGGALRYMPPQEPEFILPGCRDMSVSLNNAIIVKKISKAFDEIINRVGGGMEDVLSIFSQQHELERKRLKRKEALARLHPQNAFLYGVRNMGGYLDKKRGKRDGENLGGLKEYRFAGREWLFEDVREWMDQEGGKQTLVLLASAGFGKSAFAAQLVEEEMKDDVVAFHFCSNERTSNLNPRNFIDGLVVSLAKNVEGFTAELLELVKLQMKSDEEEPLFEPFDQGSLDFFNKFVKKKEPQDIIHDYVLEALRCVENLKDGKTKLLVIDSLDEAALEKDEKKNILDLVAEMAKKDKLPNWVKLLVTSRDQTNVTDKLKHAKKVDLRMKLEGMHKGNNEEDMRAYLGERLENDIIKPKRQDMQQALDVVRLNHWAEVDTLRTFVEAIVEKSEGMFLYAVYVVDDIEAGRLSLDQSVANFKKHLPKGIDEYYEERFEAMFNEDMDRYRKIVRPVLEVIAGAKEPIPRDVLKKASGLDGAEYDALEKITAFCKDRGEGNNETFTFIHQSFADWILNEHEKKDNDNVKFMVSKENGKEAIARVLLKKGWNSKSEYFGRQGRAHLRDAVNEWLTDAEEAEKVFGHISDWDVSEVTSMKELLHLQGAKDFNQFLYGWDAWVDLYVWLKEIERMALIKSPPHKLRSDCHTLVFNMATQRTPYNWSKDLYNKYCDYIQILWEKYRDNPETYLTIAEKIQEPFMYLDRYYVKHYNLPSLRNVIARNLEGDDEEKEGGGETRAKKG